jgi:cell fate (sporulation/competence/biofilm development) regulator YmcA (YheA/YmcA/DUF963 family)
MNLTKYDYHEALDRTYIFASLIERELKNHPVIKKNKKLNKKLGKALKHLYEVYQEIGDKSIK